MVTTLATIGDDQTRSAEREPKRSPVAIQACFATLVALGMMISSCIRYTTEPKVASFALRFRAAYFDMDGTLLNDQNEIPEPTKSALASFRRCGGRIGLVTGRTENQIRKYLPVLQPELPAILQNGALVWDNGVVGHVFGDIPSAAIAKALREAATIPDVRAIMVHLVTSSIVDREDEYTRGYASRKEARDMSVCADLAACYSRLTEPVLKVQLLVPPELAKSTREQLSRALDGELVRVVIADPSEASVEIVNSSVNKRAGVEWALSRAGLDRADVLVFGDGDNDVEMLRSFPVSITMKACSESACGAALLRTGDNDSDSIARILKYVALGSSCRE